MNGRKMISTTDTAKLIRKRLKEVYPDHKFSVRSRMYAGGSSITVSYTDGPDKDSVEKLLSVFEGVTFDGMEDMKKFNRNYMNGEEVDFEVDFIFVSRILTDEAYDWIMSNGFEYSERNGVTFYNGQVKEPTDNVTVERPQTGTYDYY